MKILEKQQRKMKNKLRKKFKLTHFLGQYHSAVSFRVIPSCGMSERAVKQWQPMRSWNNCYSLYNEHTKRFAIEV